jgi:hypothetical protein
VESSASIGKGGGGGKKTGNDPAFIASLPFPRKVPFAAPSSRFANVRQKHPEFAKHWQIHWPRTGWILPNLGKIQAFLPNIGKMRLQTAAALHEVGFGKMDGDGKMGA